MTCATTEPTQINGRLFSKSDGPARCGSGPGAVAESEWLEGCPSVEIKPEVDVDAIPHRERQRSFAAGVFLAAVLGGIVMLGVAAILEWLTR